MSNFREYVFVLWGDQFEEVVATIFVAELRKVGLWVKVVGLTSHQISGSHGLALVPDLTLDQALPLAGNMVCLVIPYASPGIKRLKNDPRIRELFALAQANKAKFVVGPLDKTDMSALGPFPMSEADIVVYPGLEDLIGFARNVAIDLQKKS